MVGLSNRFRRQERVLKQTVSGALVLFKMDAGEYFSLNDVGSRVWDLCDGNRTVGEMATIIADEYDAPLPAIEQDLLNLLGDLADDSLVVELGSAA